MSVGRWQRPAATPLAEGDGDADDLRVTAQAPHAVYGLLNDNTEDDEDLVMI